MTFSITARCPDTGMFGVAITTSSICVGSRCPWARAGVGAVASQNVTLPSIGNHVLAAMESGLSAQQALDQVVAGQQHREYRQVAVIGKTGAPAIFSGENALGTHAVSAAEHCIAAGNLLKSADLPAAMTARFAGLPPGTHLAERLLAAIEAGLYDAGGEAGPVHSAALLVVDQQEWPLVDLRMDWDETDPVKPLRALWQAYQGEMESYVLRALDPSAAPSYGVPGDE